MNKQLKKEEKGGTSTHPPENARETVPLYNFPNMYSRKKIHYTVQPPISIDQQLN